MATEKNTGLGEKLTPILVLATILLAFAVGVLWQKVENFDGSGSKTTTTAGTGTGTDTAAAPSGPTQGKLSDEQAAKVPPVTDKDHIRGGANPKVYLVEYSDFQCPFCEQFHPSTLQALDEYGDDIAVVYRHFPLRQIHPQAEPAAQASECVASIGGESAFWQFADYLFENQQTALTDLPASAAAVGVNSSAVETCLNDEKFADVVEEQYQGGITAGITGTPGSFVMTSDGQAWLIPGAVSFDSLKATIDEALQS